MTLTKTNTYYWEINMARKLIKLQELIEKSCKSTPKLKCKLVGAVGKDGHHIEFPEDIDVIVDCESK